MLDHTCNRIFQLLDFPGENFFEKFQKIEFFCKWGGDGSSGQSQYMQLFKAAKQPQSESIEVPEEENFSEQNLFLFSMVPLRLFGTTATNEKVIFWENTKPSSTKFCRPLKFKYIKETTESTLAEVKSIEAEIEELKPFEVVINGKIF